MWRLSAEDGRFGGWLVVGKCASSTGMGAGIDREPTIHRFPWLERMRLLHELLTMQSRSSTTVGRNSSSSDSEKLP